MRIVNYFIALAISMAIVSCSPKEVNKEAVARVYESYLYRNEVEERIPNNLSVDDSLALAKSITYSWIERQLLVHQAEKNLDAEIKDVEKKLQEYRNDLLIYVSSRKRLLDRVFEA